MTSISFSASNQGSRSSLRRWAGAFLVVVPIAFMAFFTILGVIFDYPAILRLPTDIVLTRFQAGGSSLIAVWYGMTFSAILFIPLVLLVHQFITSTLAPERTTWMRLATTLGVLAGAVQMLGFIRWVFLVPTLAATYIDPVSGPATKDATAVVFQAFNSYAGMGIGENLGYLFTGAWTLLVGLSLAQLPKFPSWLGFAGIIPAVGILIGMAEPIGVAFAAPVNAIGYILWAIWLVVVGVIFLVRRIDHV